MRQPAAHLLYVCVRVRLVCLSGEQRSPIELKGSKVRLEKEKSARSAAAAAAAASSGQGSESGAGVGGGGAGGGASFDAMKATADAYERRWHDRQRVGPVNVDERELMAYGSRVKGWTKVVVGARANPGYSLVRQT